MLTNRFAGWESAIRVRFLHAHVRARLLGSPHYDVSAYGVPINQEDLQVTLTVFSCTVFYSACFVNVLTVPAADNVIYGLEKLGFFIRDEEKEDYIHAWRYVGYLMVCSAVGRVLLAHKVAQGVMEQHNPLTSLVQAKAALESLVVHQVQPNFVSVQLSHHNLHAEAWQFPLYWSFGACAQYVCAITSVLVADICNLRFTRILTGDELADELLLPKSLLYNVSLRVLFRVASVIHWALPDGIFWIVVRVATTLLTSDCRCNRLVSLSRAQEAHFGWSWRAYIVQLPAICGRNRGCWSEAHAHTTTHCHAVFASLGVRATSDS